MQVYLVIIYGLVTLIFNIFFIYNKGKDREWDAGLDGGIETLAHIGPSAINFPWLCFAIYVMSL